MAHQVRDPWKAFRDGPSGTGNWYAFNRPWEEIIAAAGEWRSALKGISRPWLCWNVNNSWCVLQQKLVKEVGWTPVVGWDPMCGVGMPALVQDAIAIDFNASLKLPTVFMHIPLEFAFLWVEDRLAFWHSDLLLPRHKMRRLAHKFESLNDGEMAAVFSYGGLRNIFKLHRHRYWELAGCTTRAASKDQFEKGCGWWKNITHHINAPQTPDEQHRRRAQYREHGVGIRYWERYFDGKVRRVSERWLSEGHFSVTSVPNYKIAATKCDEMELNFDLRKIARDFGIDDLID